MSLSSRTRRLLTNVSILFGIVLTLVFTVFPKPALNLVPKPALNLLGFAGTDNPQAADTAARLFAGLNAILLAIISLAGGRRFGPDRVPASTLILPTSPGLSFGAQEPYRAIIIYSECPSFSNQGAVLEHLRSAVVLANYRPILASSFAEVENELRNRFVVGLVIDSQFQDYGLRRTQALGKALFTVERDRSFGSSHVGNRATLQIGDELGGTFPENVYATALPLAHAGTADVVRSVGFNGTWVTTYGLMSIKDDRKGKASGVYWYGDGEIAGDVEVKHAEARVVMSFDWSQANNKSRVGSGDKGRGVFVLEAGYEVFSGYWYVEGEPFSTQLWCGTRLSHDIVINMKKGKDFARDFGLSQHPLSNIVDPAD
jgi:hypothetical protein